MSQANYSTIPGQAQGDPEIAPHRTVHGRITPDNSGCN
jgi:hypothetical protein